MKLDNEGEFGWHDFRKKYMDFGGDGVYAAWQLTYLEPAFRGLESGDDQLQELDYGLCPAAESLQPKLIQLKTNYMDTEKARQKAEALAQAIRYFDG